MENELERQLNAAAEYSEVRLKGEIRLRQNHSDSFLVGNHVCRNIVMLTKSNLIVDGSDAHIVFECDERLDVNTNLFFLHASAKSVNFRNCKIDVNLTGEASDRVFCAIYNTAFGLCLHNCSVQITSLNQASLTVLCNNGNLETHLETRADNLRVENCNFSAAESPESADLSTDFYGIYNNLANSVSVQNTFVYATNRGNGGGQRAVGIFTNGWYGRFVGNNVKANGTHNVGKLKEQAHATGMINQGIYSLISSNNIVGEWAGQSIGLLNCADYAEVGGNKILATHTICGRSVKNLGNFCVFDGNFFISTSRNPRLFDHQGTHCVIANNFMESLQPWNVAMSTVGIYIADTDYSTDNVITGNIVRNVCDAGIFLKNRDVGVLRDNFFPTFAEWHGLTEIATADDVSLRDKLGEASVRSLYD